jgi:hypothetical protein
MATANRNSLSIVTAALLFVCAFCVPDDVSGASDGDIDPAAFFTEHRPLGQDIDAGDLVGLFERVRPITAMLRMHSEGKLEAKHRRQLADELDRQIIHTARILGDGDPMIASTAELLILHAEYARWALEGKLGFAHYHRLASRVMHISRIFIGYIHANHPDQPAN